MELETCLFLYGQSARCPRRGLIVKEYGFFMSMWISPRIHFTYSLSKFTIAGKTPVFTSTCSVTFTFSCFNGMSDNTPLAGSSLARVPLLLSPTTLWHNVSDSFQKHSGQQFVARDFEFNHWFSSKIGLRALLEPVAKWMTSMQVDTQKRAHLL